MASTEENRQESTIASDPSVLLSKRAVYIGGLADGVTQSVLRAAFIPFGDIQTVDIPMDYEKGTTRGFAFVEFQDAQDAEEAIFNMDGAELYGRTLRVSVAQVNQVNKLMAGGKKSTGAIWDSDEWFQANVDGGGMTKQETEAKENDETVLKDDNPTTKR